MLKKTIAACLILLLGIFALPAMPVEANTANVVNLINREPLNPEVTGLIELDKEVDRVLRALIANGHRTPGELALASYIYLKDSVAYTGKDPLPEGYPQREIPGDPWALHLDQRYGVGDSGSYRVLFYRHGVCDHYSEAYATFLRRIGIAATVVGGHYVRNDGTLDDHAWVVARLGGKYYAFDPEVDDWISVDLGRPFMGHFGEPMSAGKHYRLYYEHNNPVPSEDLTKVLDYKMSYINNQQNKNGVVFGKYLPMRANADSIFAKPKPNQYQRLVRIFLNQRPLKSDVNPIIQSGRTLVPLRVIGEALRADVDWKADEQLIYLYRGEDKLIFKIGVDHYYRNDDRKSLDVSAKIVNGRTMVPLRAVSEAFDCAVEWDGEEAAIYISE